MEENNYGFEDDEEFGFWDDEIIPCEKLLYTIPFDVLRVC